MKKADLKTDGTVYFIEPQWSIPQNLDPARDEGVRAVLLDLNSSDAPRQSYSGYDREQRPIKAKIVGRTGLKSLNAGDIVHVSARRVLITEEGRKEAQGLAAEAKQRWEIQVQEQTAKTRATINALSLRLVATGLDKLVKLGVSSSGGLTVDLDRLYGEMGLEELLARVEAKQQTTEEKT
jgi:hypothetical protein